MARPSFAGAVLILALGSMAACRSAPPDAASADADVRATLDEQVAAWNRGDLRGFMEGYLASPDLTFVSGTHVERGWQPTLERYLARYPAGKQGTLAFEDLEVHVLPGGNDAWVLGRYRLSQEVTQSGRFTLVLRRVAGRFRVVHDHTSSDPPPDGP